MKLLLTGLLAAALSTAFAQSSPAYLDYISTYAPLAVAEMHTSGIPASITLAQGLLESGAGQSTLARKANNHFGIKCHSSWKGKRMYRKDDDRNKHGKLIESCFRSYPHPAESYADHSSFLMNGQRYAGLFLLSRNDYKGWAKGLKRAGYATSRTYADKLIGIIESYELHAFDEGSTGMLAVTDVVHQARTSKQQERRPVLSGASRPVASASRKQRVTKTPVKLEEGGSAFAETKFANDVKYTNAEAGESLRDIAKRTRKSTQELVKYNESLSRSTTRPRQEQRVYLQPKRKSFRGRAKTHTVAQRETLQQIADLYGVRTQSLRDRNRIPAQREPRAGQYLQLRGRRKRGDEVRLRPTTEDIAARPAVRKQTTTPITASSKRTPTPEELVPTPSVPPLVVAEPALGKVSATAPANSTARPEQLTAATTQSIRVEAGDTLWSISRRAGVSVPQLRALNSLEGNTIHVGQELVVTR